MMKMLPKIFSVLLLTTLIFAAPALVSAQGFIVCDDAPNSADTCDFYDLLELVKALLDWLVLISFPAAIITFAWAGFLFLTTAVVDQRTKAKGMLWKVVIGFAIILAAWLIVRTIVNTILAPNIGDQFIIF